MTDNDTDLNTGSHEDAGSHEDNVTPSEQTAIAEATIIKRGKLALEDVRGQFYRWLQVADALAIGRAHAMNEAGINDPDLVTASGVYRSAMNRWLSANSPFDDRKKLPDVCRHYLLRCWDHKAAIIAFRQLDPIEDTRYNYPETAFKRWARKERPDLLTQKQNDETGDKDNNKSQNATAEAVLEASGQVIESANHVIERLNEHDQQLNLPFGPLPDQAAINAAASAAVRAYDKLTLSSLSKMILLLIGDLDTYDATMFPDGTA